MCDFSFLSRNLKHENVLKHILAGVGVGITVNIWDLISHFMIDSFIGRELDLTSAVSLVLSFADRRLIGDVSCYSCQVCRRVMRGHVSTPAQLGKLQGRTTVWKSLSWLFQTTFFSTILLISTTPVYICLFFKAYCMKIIYRTNYVNCADNWFTHIFYRT